MVLHVLCGTRDAGLRVVSALAGAVTGTLTSATPYKRRGRCVIVKARTEGRNGHKLAAFFLPYVSCGAPHMIELRPPLTLSSKSEKEGIYGGRGSTRAGLRWRNVGRDGEASGGAENADLRKSIRWGVGLAFREYGK